MNFTVTFILGVEKDVTGININTNLFSKKQQAPHTQRNSMEGRRGHLIPLTSLDKIYLHSEVQSADWELCQG